MNTILPTIENALNSLEIKNWRILGTPPTNEGDFNSRFEKEMSNTNGVATYSNSPSNFGVTWSQVKTALDTLQAEYDALEYSRNRKAEYPDWGTQLNKIYDDGLTKWKTEMVDPIKAKYPKPA